MYGDASSEPKSKAVQSYPGASRRLGTLLRDISDDSSDEDEDDTGTSESINASKPWLAEFNGYLHSRDILGNLSVVQWWGVRLFRLSAFHIASNHSDE